MNIEYGYSVNVRKMRKLMYVKIQKLIIQKLKMLKVFLNAMCQNVIIRSPFIKSIHVTGAVMQVNSSPFIQTG